MLVEIVEYVFISGFEIIKIATKDKLKQFISNMGNNIVTCPIVKGEKKQIFVI